jgi:hypothetical protein
VRVLVLWIACGCGHFGFGNETADAVSGDAAPTIDASGTVDTPGTSGPYVYVKASNTGKNDQFGTALALSADGRTLAVGAPVESSNATGIDQSQSDNSASAAGAVYVFRLASGQWQQNAYVKASNTNGDDRFGSSVALSADGTVLAVGAPGEASAIPGNQNDNSAPRAGAVYVFARTSSSWTQDGYIKPMIPTGGAKFGTSVALSGNGSTLVVGAPGEASNATGINGNQADKSDTGAGAAYRFVRTTNSWTQQDYIKAPNTFASAGFGASVAVSEDATTVAVGSPSEASAATGIDGNELDHSASGTGAVYTYGGPALTTVTYFKASHIGVMQFGATVAIASDGSTLAVGATAEAGAATGIDGDQTNQSAAYAGAVFVFGLLGGTSTWGQTAYVKASNTDMLDLFGDAVALDGTGAMLAVGARGEASRATGIGGDQTDNSAGVAGAAYAFVRNNAWQQTGYIKASNTRTNNSFGAALAIDRAGTTIAVGSPGEPSDATGIDGNELDTSMGSAGAVYLLTP